MLPTFDIAFYRPNGERDTYTEVGPTRAGRRVTLLLMDRCEVISILERV